MPAEFEELPPLIVASIRHSGKHSPEVTSHTWEELILWASPKRLLGRQDGLRGIGLLWDDPRQWPAELRRYDVGIPISPEDSAHVAPPAFLHVTMPGRYLRVTHRGPYEEIMSSYRHAFDVTMKVEDLELVSAPMIELYRNSPSEVAPEHLVTDIYLPVTHL